MLVNPGIGIPTLVWNYLPKGVQIFFQSENGLIGAGTSRQRASHTPMVTDRPKPNSSCPQVSLECNYESWLTPVSENRSAPC
jgi:acetate CoA/acetoacetate CoA-transferase beta subunit